MGTVCANADRPFSHFRRLGPAFLQIKTNMRFSNGIYLCHISSTLFFPSFSLADVLCDLTALIWREETLFEAMSGRTSIIDGHLVEVFRGFRQS